VQYCVFLNRQPAIITTTTIRPPINNLSIRKVTKMLSKSIGVQGGFTNTNNHLGRRHTHCQFHQTHQNAHTLLLRNDLHGTT